MPRPLYEKAYFFSGLPYLMASLGQTVPHWAHIRQGFPQSGLPSIILICPVGHLR